MIFPTISCNCHSKINQNKKQKNVRTDRASHIAVHNGQRANVFCFGACSRQALSYFNE